MELKVLIRTRGSRVLARAGCLALAGVLVFGTGCKPERKSPREEFVPQEEAPASDEAAKEEVEVPFNIGDVEQAIDFEADLDAEAVSANVKAEKVTDLMNRVKIMNVTVSPPYPEHLVIRYTLNCRQAFAERPVVVRGKIADGERELAAFAVFLGENSRSNEFEQEVDVLEGLDEVPETVGLMVTGEAILLPAGSDEASVDPKTATGDERSEALYSTFVRVDFEGAGDTAADGGSGA